MLPLTWPVSFDPLEYKRFETDARTLRYQALGRACLAHGIRSLLVAHHADDQAETIMMRLANNRLRSGLQAMQPVEWIPECFGIHGVSHSTKLEQLEQSSPQSLGIVSNEMPIETGGVRIVRPLLGFDKSRLIATCKEHGVIWAEDKTNHVQTYTSRNAIRHVLKNHKLPTALSIPSLVDVSVHMQRRINVLKSKAYKLLAACPKQLDVQTGSLLIDFPPFHELLDRPVEDSKRQDPTWGLSQSDWSVAKNTAVCLLAQAGQMVSPKELTSPGELASSIVNIWPAFHREVEAPPNGEYSAATNGFCMHGIWWRKWDRPLYEHSRSDVTYLSEDRLPKSEQRWLLTRQPLMQSRSAVASRRFVYPPSHDLLSDQLTSSDSNFQLFDGRWWISVTNRSPNDLILRPFMEQDLSQIGGLQIAKLDWPEQLIAIVLSTLKPADVRFTLPALFQQDSATKKETLIGFPTLDVSIGKWGYPEDICAWQVHYKKLSYESDSIKGSNVLHPNTSISTLRKGEIERQVERLNKRRKKRLSTSEPERVTVPDLLAAQDRGEANGTGSPSARPRAKTRSTNSRGSVRVAKGDAESPSPKRKTANQERTFPLVPTPESERRGKSEKREGGGYNIKWNDFGERF